MVKSTMLINGKEISPSQAGKIAEDFIIKWLSKKSKYIYVARFSDTMMPIKAAGGQVRRKLFFHENLVI